MIRARFTTNSDDPRPISWPMKHPYWITGWDLVGNSRIVAYADSEEDILRLWPAAVNIESEERQEYIFTDRFPKPEWFTEA